MDAAALQSLFEKCLTCEVPPKKMALVFAGVNGYILLRARMPVERRELGHESAWISTSLTQLDQWLEKHPKYDGVDRLRTCMKHTLRAYAFLKDRAFNEHASELAQMLRRGLSEHLSAVDALAGLTGNE